ncbi:ArsR family transcriptional regulator [Endozoicomonas montiporae]|uniref:ArsR family transcriptional regulator n=2 Tax=Endozoicomonas montiporae TaxID=1027273 RepID=A0A081MZQ6_9GAMM|nr:metalloregulator ArsR/SmtB family transcription factor [Endozoicomonas montiporae]AMO54631.1 ArsR family transcriptional regulator [Endozoicomonas montiporae CL-33]KEQ11679.1 ArsR family transcriptional regulator [Endozoicomonas montiporae]
MSDTEMVDQLAAFGKAVGDALRLQVLRVLSTDSFGVLELSRVFDMRQPAMSHHLKVLAQAGLVSTRKEGNTVFYRRSLPPSSEGFGDAVRAIFRAVDGVSLPEELECRLEAIREQRAEQSMVFFTRHVGEFRQHQELIADHDLYARCVAEVLKTTDMPEQALALELGPGEGEFLETLSQRFNQVYAVDNCSEMLTSSQHFADRHALKNIEFVHGELKDLQHLEEQFDCIVANMVLHHIPSPSGIFKRVTGLLKPGGSFLVSDLSQHDQDWVRESCGDIWLGFSSDDLDNWALEAGLNAGESQYLGLRNGFQIQVRRFYR